MIQSGKKKAFQHSLCFIFVLEWGKKKKEQKKIKKFY